MFAILFDAYPTWLPVLFVPAIVLVFASWQLTASWMARPSRHESDWRYLGYAVFAMVLPFILVLGTRWATMPSADKAWRQRMENHRFAETDQAPIAIVAQAPPSSFLSGNSPSNASWTYGREREEAFLERVEKELSDTEAVGAHVSFQGLLVAPWSTDSTNTLTDEERTSAAIRSARVALKWSNVVRKEAVAGRIRFRTLLESAEPAQVIAVNLLDELIDRVGMTPEIADLCAQLPDEAFVRESRSAALIAEWRSSRGSQCFGEYSGRRTTWSDFLERPRARRNAEKAIRLALERWNGGTQLTARDQSQIVDYLLSAGFQNPINLLRQRDLRAYGLRERIKNTSTVLSE